MDRKERTEMRQLRLTLVIAVCTTLGLIGSSAVTLAASEPVGSAQPPSGACQPAAPNSPINSAFASQWQQGEASAPNFWGPTDTAAFNEQYAEGSTGFSESGPTNPGQGMRLVQYFDKGRMELTHPASGIVTNGLLANELITGEMQIGDTAFQQRAPANIPIAGDPDNPGPTYAGLGTKGATLFDPAASQTPTTRNLGVLVETRVAADGTVTTKQQLAAQGPKAIAIYDSQTQHNVPTAFADYRNKVGLLTVGLAKSEPFLTTVKVAGAQQQVMVQVFERRVLTYTDANPDPFKVEMGNIGQHYYQWRYCGT
jgi:hypothetical protein